MAVVALAAEGMGGGERVGPGREVLVGTRWERDGGLFGGSGGGVAAIRGAGVVVRLFGGRVGFGGELAVVIVVVVVVVVVVLGGVEGVGVDVGRVLVGVGGRLEESGGDGGRAVCTNGSGGHETGCDGREMLAGLERRGFDAGIVVIVEETSGGEGGGGEGMEKGLDEGVSHFGELQDVSARQ